MVSQRFAHETRTVSGSASSSTSIHTMPVKPPGIHAGSHFMKDVLVALDADEHMGEDKDD